ncbi:MAG: PDZ domain-containing protein [Sphingomonadaceae bacterium]|nr:PDZ domain-containing protein [Sphingomonadaceae bacterium]
MSTPLASWLLGAALALAVPVTLQVPARAESAASQLNVDRTALARQQREEARFHALAWQLVTGNAAFCANSAPAIGLVLQDVQGFAAPGRIRAAAGIAGDIFVQVVIPGSPADKAGLRVGDEILAIGSRPVSDFPSDSQERWRRQVALQDALDANLATTGTAVVRWRRAGGVAKESRFLGEPACPSRFELRTEGDDAMAEGSRVVFGREFAGFAYPDDELAAALAHELAHNLLRHREWLATQGRKQSAIRKTEREADRLMPWLLANAGFEPEAAIRFMVRWGKKHDAGLLRKRTHDGWDERVEAIEAEVVLVKARLAAGGVADWSSNFRRGLE